jgi:fatty acid desaturase
VGQSITFTFRQKINQKGWRKAHPAGEHWIDYYDGRDATEVMDAFHSEKARKMYQRLPQSKFAQQLEATTPADSTTQIAFRNLRTQLEAEGWWERDIVHESKLLAIWASLVLSAAVTAHTVAPLSTFLLGLAMTNAGWLGHDYIHGVDEFCSKLRLFCPAAAGLAPTWWSDKHNKHHALSKFDKDVCVCCVADIVVDAFQLRKSPSLCLSVLILASVSLSCIAFLVLLTQLFKFIQPMKKVSMKTLQQIHFFINGLQILLKILLFVVFNTYIFQFLFPFYLPCGDSIQ